MRATLCARRNWAFHWILGCVALVGLGCDPADLSPKSQQNLEDSSGASDSNTSPSLTDKTTRDAGDSLETSTSIPTRSEDLDFANRESCLASNAECILLATNATERQHCTKIAQACVSIPDRASALCSPVVAQCEAFAGPPLLQAICDGAQALCEHQTCQLNTVACIQAASSAMQVASCLEEESCTPQLDGTFAACATWNGACMMLAADPQQRRACAALNVGCIEGSCTHAVLSCLSQATTQDARDACMPLLSTCLAATCRLNFTSCLADPRQPTTTCIDDVIECRQDVCRQQSRTCDPTAEGDAGSLCRQLKLLCPPAVGDLDEDSKHDPDESKSDDTDSTTSTGTPDKPENPNQDDETATGESSGLDQTVEQQD